MRNRQAKEGLADVAEFRAGAFEKFSAGRGVEKEIADFDDGADISGRRLGLIDLSAACC